MLDNRSPRILITRLSHIGDCILTLPVLNALRSCFPKAFIAWAVEPPSDQLLHDHGALDHLIVVPRGWMKSPSAVLRLRKQLQALRFDIVIDPQSLTKSSLLGWLSGAPRRIGFAKDQGRELALWLNNERVQPRMRHVVDRSLELLRPFGIRSPQVQFAIPQDPSAQETIQTFIQNAHLANGFALINPGAGWASRLWPTKRYATVAKYLGQNRDLPSVVAWAGEPEHQWAEQIVQHSGGHAHLAPKTNLRELAELLKAARLFIGSDTGPMHLAVAGNTDCVVLHGTTRPQDSGAYGGRHISLQKYYQAGTSRQRRKAANDAMRTITSHEVCHACDRILGRQQIEAA